MANLTAEVAVFKMETLVKKNADGQDVYSELRRVEVEMEAAGLDLLDTLGDDLAEAAGQAWDAAEANQRVAAAAQPTRRCR